MKFALLVQSAPEEANPHALELAQQICQSGDELAGVFFQREGVRWGLTGRPESKEGGQARGWNKLSGDYAVPLWVCSASAQQQGLGRDDFEPGFEISGLGRLVELQARCDRCIQFKSSPSEAVDE